MNASSAWGIVGPGHSRNSRLSARCLRLSEVAAGIAERREPRVVVLTGRPRGSGPSEAEQVLGSWAVGDVQRSATPC